MTGWLVYKYRVQSCLQHFDTIVVSNTIKAKNEFEVPDDRFHILEYNAHSTVRKFLNFPKIFPAIKQFKPDMLFFLGTTIYGATSWAIRSVPYTMFWNEHPIRIAGCYEAKNTLALAKCNFIKSLYYATARQAHTIMPNSIFHVQDLIQHNVEPQRIHLVHIGVDDSFISPPRDYRKNTDDPIKIVHSGSVLESRGSLLILEALAKAKQRGAKVQVRMVGAKDDQVADYTNKAREYKIDDCYTISPRVPGSQIPGILHESDVGLCIWANHDYWQYNPPTKLFEFLVAGLPVLASNIRTHTQYIQDGTHGFVFDYDAEALGNAFIRLWEQRELLHGMRKNSLQAGEEYLWHNVEPKFIRALS